MILKQTDFLLQRPSIILFIPLKAGVVDCLESIIMRQYLTFHEKILLLVYYCFRLAFQIFKVRGLTMPSSTRPSVQKPEPSQSFDRLLNSLRGHTVEIHNLDKVYVGYPEGTGPDLERLRRACDEKLETLALNKARLNRLKRADFGLSASMWWPNAKFDNVVVAMFLIIWIFTWDDDLDEKGGSVYDNFEAAETRRKETLEYLRCCLGSKKPESYTKPTSPLILSFKPIGDSLRKGFTTDQCQRLLKNLEAYIEGSRIEQDLRMKATIPTIDKFWNYRLQTSAVYATTSVLELCSGTQLPQHVFDDVDMKSIWKETNIMISCSNDMFSLKKEIAHGQVDNIVALLCHNKHLKAQQAMDEADAIVRSAKMRFDKSAKKLAVKYPDDTIEGRQIKAFIEGCKYNMTGNQNFSLVSPRYGLANFKRGNSLVFTL
ncbi:hypothetical protein JMJ35_002313 [Cladonia borealis]|uniref:Terpene synthase n=1 Tax=Cladonia borealis TaxID=184061 RepID=A0AA39V6T3_9LECA|nr:hypothetical protein JMJ35_002313 [Cladonia borealis]